MESIVSNARDTISLTVLSDGSGDGDCSSVFVGVRVAIISSISHRHCQIRRGGDVVVDATHHKVVGICREAAQ